MLQMQLLTLFSSGLYECFEIVAYIELCSTSALGLIISGITKKLLSCKASQIFPMCLSERGFKLER